MAFSAHAPTVSSGNSTDRASGAGDDVRQRCSIAAARHARQHSRAAAVPDDVDRAAPGLYASPNVCGGPGSMILPSCPGSSPNAFDGISTSAGPGSAGVFDRTWFLPGGASARTVSPRGRADAFVRLPARIRCHLEVGLVQYRRCGAVPPVRLRRLHQSGTHAVGNQSQQPQRIRASATKHRQPTH